MYDTPSSEQRLFANELLNYLNADARVENLEDALDDLEDSAKRKILSCVITYLYLYDHTTESMEQDAQEDFIDLFDLGRKTLKSLKQQTEDTYRLRGVDGCIDRYITAPIKITEETPFEVELPEPETVEATTADNTAAKSGEEIDTNAPREKLVLSGSIQVGGETIYQNKDIHFASAIMSCSGNVKFINCTIHYNEDGSRIYLNGGTSLEIASSTVICHGNCKEGNYFIQTVEQAIAGNHFIGTVRLATAGNCIVKNSDCVACVGFLKGSYENFQFESNRVIGSCSDFLYLFIENKATISNSRFLLPDQPTFEAKDGNNNPGNAFINCSGTNVFFNNNIFEGEKSTGYSSYMTENGIYTIYGSAWIGYDDEKEERERGTVSNCTFLRMNRCIYHMGTIRNCIFEKCSEAIVECTAYISENRFTDCNEAVVNACARTVVSNCQFVSCKGTKLVTSRWNSQVTIQDCEFTNISISPARSVEEIEQFSEAQRKKYIREFVPGKISVINTKGALIEFGGVDKKFANSNRPSRIERCVFNNAHISSEGGFICEFGKWRECEASKNLKKDQMNFLISVYTANYERFNYPRVIVSDCTFNSCASSHKEIINTEPYDSVFGSKHNYTAIDVRNNCGLDRIKNLSDFIECRDIKLKETDAAGNKIGSTLSV